MVSGVKGPDSQNLVLANGLGFWGHGEPFLLHLKPYRVAKKKNSDPQKFDYLSPGNLVVYG